MKDMYTLDSQYRLTYRHDVLQELRLFNLLNFSQSEMGNLSRSNINPQYDGRTINLKDIPTLEYEDVLMSLMQISDFMTKAIHRDLGASEDVQMESMFINRWPAGSSLGLHADNAWYEPGCDNHLQPNYTPWRTHSCVYYMNTNFSGGSLHFKDGLSITAPENSFFGFSAGLDAVHGVSEITNGDRWTVGVWFSDDPEHQHQWPVNVNASIVEHLKSYTG